MEYGSESCITHSTIRSLWDMGKKAFILYRNTWGSQTAKHWRYAGTWETSASCLVRMNVLLWVRHAVHRNSFSCYMRQTRKPLSGTKTSKVVCLLSKAKASQWVSLRCLYFSLRCIMTRFCSGMCVYTFKAKIALRTQIWSCYVHVWDWYGKILMQELNPWPSLAMPVLHKYIPALILNNNYQSILGR